LKNKCLPAGKCATLVTHLCRLDSSYTECFIKFHKITFWHFWENVGGRKYSWLHADQSGFLSYQSASSATVAMTDKGRGDTEETLLSASRSLCPTFGT